MIKISAYETTPCRGYQIDKIEKELKVAFLPNGESEYGNRLTVVDALFNNDSASLKLPSFAHPVFNEGTNKWTIDIRPFTAIDMRTMKCVIKDPSEVKFNKLRGELCAVFEKESGRNYLRDLSSVIVTVFSSWISENIARRFSLPADAQYRLYIYAAVYYQSLFYDIAEDDEMAKQQIALRLSRDMKVKSEDVFSVMDSIEEESILNMDINVFCQYAQHVTGSIRLEKFNPALLYTIIGGTWLSFNAREVACVALEHVPTFIAMVAQSAQSRGHTVSPFAKLVTRKSKRELEDLGQKLNNILVLTLDK